MRRLQEIWRLGLGLMLLLVTVLLLSAVGVNAQNAAADLDLTDPPTVMAKLLDTFVSGVRSGQGDRSVFDAVAKSGDQQYIAPLIDLAYFSRGLTTEIEFVVFEALGSLTGQAFAQDWEQYFLWASAQNVPMPPGYAEFKGNLYTYIDPQFRRFFMAGAEQTANVNLLEVIWGGVRVDGIPALVNADQITPQQAMIEGATLEQFCRQGDCSYPAADEYVFGVSLNGDHRAYPLRVLNWHEMFNDEFGRVPLYDQPNGTILCQYRAGADLTAVARQAETWVKIVGRSAGCPTSGDRWLQADALRWASGADWASVRQALPDVTTGATPLAIKNGVKGSVIGTPVLLAYCTLCGSGILYDVTIPNLVIDGVDQGRVALEFGSTGLLMRSNKLMYDRKTDTVWNALTGKPAFGKLANSGIELQRLPVVVTDWGSWLKAHPDTSVLSLFTDVTRNYTNGAAYNEYFNNPDFIMFPVWQQDTTIQANKTMVFTLLLNDTPKAYPLDLLSAERVVNDTLAAQEVVIVAHPTVQREFFEPGGAEVRAYERSGQQFARGETRSEIVDQTGLIWTVTEDALIAADGQQLKRLPGHLAFWFGWYSFYPETLIYVGAGTEAESSDDSAADVTAAAVEVEVPEGLAVGERAPDFETVLATGEPVRLSAYRGKVVLLNFWATWCGPCRVEMPEFQAQFAQFNDALVVVAVNNQETVEDVLGFRDEFGLTFPLLMDERGEIQALYNLFSYPSTYVLDRNGVIVAKLFGALTAQQIQDIVTSTLES